MKRNNIYLNKVLKQLRHPLAKTWAGLLVERAIQAFWPLWTFLAMSMAVPILGLQNLVPAEAFRIAAGVSITGLLLLALYGVLRFRWPLRREAIERMDGSLHGKPLSMLADVQAIGKGDLASEAVWHAQMRLMAARAEKANAVAPNLQLSEKDPLGLRYVALMCLSIALLFGSISHVETVANSNRGENAAAAVVSTWEGWIEPPEHTGLPSLYLADQSRHLNVPMMSRVILRFYGEPGAITVSETVSSGSDHATTDMDHEFFVSGDGMLRLEGFSSVVEWSISAIVDEAPHVEILPSDLETAFDGQMSQRFAAGDDYGVVSGTATFLLDHERLERTHGLSVEPEPRDPIVLDLPMPIVGSRENFEEQLVENLSANAWAHLPVVLELEVRDALGQIGTSERQAMHLPARRFFDPLAASVVELRRDLLWSKENSKRVSQLLRAISHMPDESLFRNEANYTRLRYILRQLESYDSSGRFSNENRDEVAEAMWKLALKIEDGDISNALERLRAARERLEEAMRNGASSEEIARLMEELRDATRDYMRQRMRHAMQNGELNQQQMSDSSQMLEQRDIQNFLDRIQELMEQGRFAEAQQALEEFQRMMENMQMAQGGSGQPSAGQQAMEGLAETLRNQQGLSDEAFRNLQEQFNPNAEAGENQMNEGQSGGLGRGQSHEGQGAGRSDRQGSGEGGMLAEEEGQSRLGLADRQAALRRELRRQREGLPYLDGEAGRAARDALDRAGDAMDGAEEALRNNDVANAIDRQAEAMEELREGMRNLGQALAEENSSGNNQGQALGQFGEQRTDPFGRRPGLGRNAGTRDNLLQGEDTYRRAREILDEIRRRSGEMQRPDMELQYLERLLDRF